MTTTDLLAKAEEYKLGTNRDALALEFVEEFSRLIHVTRLRRGSVAYQYYKAELWQEGCLGMLRGVETFDGRGNIRPYVAQHIKWKMMVFLNREMARFIRSVDEKKALKCRPEIASTDWEDVASKLADIKVVAKAILVGVMREVFFDYYGIGRKRRTIKEIMEARNLGYSCTTSHLYFARENIKKEFGTPCSPTKRRPARSS